MPTIHATAIVDPRAELADDVQVDAYSVIGPGVILGARTAVYSHTIIQGMTAIGAGCKIGPAAHVGLDPQHLGFLANPDRPPTWLEIGERTIVREGASLHRSIKPGRENATRVGDDCLLMGQVHIAHDCHVANRVIMANGVLLGGHVHIDERAFLGGGAVFHQHVRVGRLTMIAGNEAISRDVPPFAAARYGGLKAYNAVGCRRAGMSRESIGSIRRAYECFHRLRTTSAVVEALRKISPTTPEVNELIEFVAGTKRGIQPSLKFLNYLHSDDDGE